MSAKEARPTKHVVGPVRDFPPGSQSLVHVNGRPIAVFNVDGTFYALFNRCPHEGGPLCSGHVTGWLSSPGPGRYDYHPEHKVVRCPWHGWEYDLKTGQSWTDPETSRVRSYRVEVESGEALQAAVEGGPPGAVPGPYVAETIPVSVEDDYVVLDLSRQQSDRD